MKSHLTQVDMDKARNQITLSMSEAEAKVLLELLKTNTNTLLVDLRDRLSIKVET